MTEKYMRMAIGQAKKALLKDEVPVGAIIVDASGKIIARAFNQRNTKKSVIAHAEILAIEKACKVIGDWRLNGCAMYVTLEPCAMCAGAIVNARIDKVYFGAKDPTAGCCGTVMNVTEHFILNHKTESEGGILAEECSQLITDYFKSKRKLPV